MSFLLIFDCMNFRQSNISLLYLTDLFPRKPRTISIEEFDKLSKFPYGMELPPKDYIFILLLIF